MTTSTTFANKAIATVMSLRDTRINDFDAKFTTANDSLYNLLGSVYESATFNYDKKDVRTALIAHAKNEHGFTFKEKNPNIFAVMLKIVFADNNVDLRRISSYKRALEIVYVDAQENGVFTKAQFIKFVKKAGGIEEVRKQSDEEKVTLTLDERVTKAVAATACMTAPLKPEAAPAFAEYTKKLAEGSVVAFTGIVMNGELNLVPTPFTGDDADAVISKATKEFFTKVATRYADKKFTSLAERKENAERKIARKERIKTVDVELKKAVKAAPKKSTRKPVETLKESAPYDNCMHLLDGVDAEAIAKERKAELEAAN